MTAILIAVGALLGYVLCLFTACRLAFREIRGSDLPAATARELRRQRRALRAQLPGDRVRR